jgi:hypothetical protein
MSRKKSAQTVSNEDDSIIVLSELRKLNATLASVVEILQQQAATAAVSSSSLSEAASSGSPRVIKSCSDYTFPGDYKKITEITVALTKNDLDNAIERVRKILPNNKTQNGGHQVFKEPMYISIKIISRDGGSIVFRALQSKNGPKPSCIEVYASTDLSAPLLAAFIEASSTTVLPHKTNKKAPTSASAIKSVKSNKKMEAKKKEPTNKKRGLEQISIDVNKEKTDVDHMHMSSIPTNSATGKKQKKTNNLFYYSDTSISASISDTGIGRRMATRRKI